MPDEISNGKRIFLNWDKHSSVRSAPRRIVPDIKESRLFSSNLAPVLAHPMVRRLSEDKIRKIEAQFLFYYLQFTEYLETCLVNKVLLSIINDEFPLAIGGGIKNDAFKIYCDEAYHAQQARDIICQIKNVSEETPLDLPIALKPRLTLLMNNFPAHLLPLFNLFFVCVAETLVSQELREHIKDKFIHPGIQDIMRDHAKDEAVHALFFKEIMFCLKRQLSHEDYLCFLGYIPHFLEAYLVPERSNLRAIFIPHLAKEDIDTILNESLCVANIGILISNSSILLRHIILEIDKR